MASLQASLDWMVVKADRGMGSLIIMVLCYTYYSIYQGPVLHLLVNEC